MFLPLGSARPDGEIQFTPGHRRGENKLLQVHKPFAGSSLWERRHLCIQVCIGNNKHSFNLWTLNYRSIWMQLWAETQLTPRQGRKTSWISFTLRTTLPGKALFYSNCLVHVVFYPHAETAPSPFSLDVHLSPAPSSHPCSSPRWTRVFFYESLFTSCWGWDNDRFEPHKYTEWLSRSLFCRTGGDLRRNPLRQKCHRCESVSTDGIHVTVVVRLGLEFLFKVHKHCLYDLSPDICWPLVLHKPTS